MIKVDINTVTTYDILQVYSGRSGCGCGCRGSYRYNTRHLNEAIEDAGSRTLEKSDFNDTQVAKVLSLIKQHPDDLKWNLDGWRSNVGWETESRYYWAYFTKAFIDRHQREWIRHSDVILHLWPCKSPRSLRTNNQRLTS